MNSARDAVGDLDVDLREDVLLVDAGLADVTDGSGLNHVSDAEALDSLVLRHHAVAVGAADGLDVATTALVASVRCSLLRHFLACCNFSLK